MRESTLEVHHDLERMRITTYDLLGVARGDRQVRLDPATRDELQKRREDVEKFVRNSKTQHYGFNRGFGHNVHLSVGPEGTGKLQINLIRSHSCGIGDPLPKEVVRTAMFLRAISLSKGHSGVRPQLIERLLNMLNDDIVPVVPRFGSVGASGDLAPLSHMALPLMGEGYVYWSRHPQPEKRCIAVPSAQVLELKGWLPLELEMKEGLALNNGVQISTAMGFIVLDQIRTMLHNATLVTALTTQVMLGADTPFRHDLHALRPHPGACRVADWIWQLMQNSPMRDFHRPYSVDGEVQDPYNVRCAAQILGACADLIDDAEQTLLIEANSVTDNPVILELTTERVAYLEKGELDDEEVRRRARDGQVIDIVSGGHFHGMPVAVRLYGLMEAIAIMARLSNMRAARYIDEDRNRGLGSDLIWPTESRTGTSSGMMIPEYVSAALTNWIWGSSMPTHLFSISTDAGQEDHVSMSAGLAVRLMETVPRCAEVLAIEYAYAAQALAIRREQAGIPSKSTKSPDGQVPWGENDRKLSPAGEAVIDKLHQAGVFPPLKEDAVLSDRLQAVARLVLDGTLVRIASDKLSEEHNGAQSIFPDPRIDLSGQQ